MRKVHLGHKYQLMKLLLKKVYVEYYDVLGSTGMYSDIN